MYNVVQIDTRRVFRETSEQIFERTKARELGLSRMLMAYIVSGLAFMLLPGTFLGVWNLISITSHRAAETVSPTWIQAHGHAQIFGWIGSFILGIGFHSIPTVRRKVGFSAGWICFGMWTGGVLLRWLTNVYLWHWRVTLPVSAILELAAFLIFFRQVSRHETRDSGQARLEPWIWIVVVATIGFLGALVMNAWLAISASLNGSGPAISPSIDARFLALCTWGFLVPFVWGFSAKWLPIFLGLRRTFTGFLASALAINLVGVAAALSGKFLVASISALSATVTAIVALRLFQRPERAAKVSGVHISFPYFVRSAYMWLLIAAGLSIWASLALNSAGIWGAARHALTVGFLGVMVFSIGQRVLPAFSGMRVLYSTKVMLLALTALSLGCILRVSSEVIAYQDYAQWAWKALPVSALLELSGVTLFATNLVITFSRRPAHLLKQSSLSAAATLLRKES